ncbi:hypothetical protein ACKWTF_012755 [Chironomus riparius]
MNIASMFTSKISSIPDYQQQSGHKNFDIHYKTFLHPISVQHTQSSMFSTNPFQRTFASVVSCKTPILQKPNDNASKKGFLNPNNDGILSCILKKFTTQKRTTMLPPKVPYFEPSHVQKEFEDFTTLPTYLQHNNQRTASAKSNSQSMHNVSNKNRHERHRHSIEHDIRVDCDIFNIKKVNNNNKTTLRNTKQINAIKLETENLPNSGNSLNPPFEIQSLKEFPAISPSSTTTTSSHDQTVNASIIATTKTSTDESDESDYVKFHDDIAKTTPTFIPRRYNLCEKVTSIVKSPKKLLSIPMMSPKRSCLKPTMRRTRTVSECSDDFIVFDRSCCGESNTNIDNIDSDNEMEDEDEDESDISEDEEDDGVVDDNIESDESDEDLDEDCLDGNNNQHLSDIMNYDSHQPDSGVEERKVHFNLVPKVHKIVAWNYAYRQARRGDIWRQGAVDRERFAKRIAECSKSINPILDRDHRHRIFEDRFRELEAQ